MSQSTLSQIEEHFSQLPVSEQKALLDRLARRVHSQAENGDDGLLVQMATDPDIQRELRELEREFAIADADGLDHT